MFVSEFDSFILKFKHLWQAGHIAHLDVDANAGEAWVGLRVQLGQPPGHPEHLLPSPTFSKSKNTPSRQRRRARRAAERETNVEKTSVKTTVENAVFKENEITEEVVAKETADKAAVPSPQQPPKDVAVQASTTSLTAVDAAVQAVEETSDGAVQASLPPHQEGPPSDDVLVLAEQAGQPLRADIPLHHHLEDLLCRDREYLPALGRLPDHDQYRVDRAREREKDLENFTKMLEDSLK